MSRFEVLYYETETGSCPISDFLDSLNVKMRAKVFMTISFIEEFGNQLSLPYSRHIRKGIFELRVKSGSDTCRLMYFFTVQRQVILTNGFIKKTLKTPPGEIHRAEIYKADYERRFPHYENISE